MSSQPETPAKPIELSQFTQALFDNLKAIKPKTRPDDLSKLAVSQTVSFLAFAYEKVRNAVEYHDDHLIRRAAIERIVKRRLALNPQGHGEAEDVLRELLWARYFPNGSLGSEDVKKIQNIIEAVLTLKKLTATGRDLKEKNYLQQFLTDLLTCEIEETLNPEGTARNANFTFFIYQILRKKIKIEGLTEEQKDAFFLAALEKAYRKSDSSYQRYHLFLMFYKQLASYTQEELHHLSTKLPASFKKIDQMIQSPLVENLTRFARKQLPPFLIFFEIIKSKFANMPAILADKEKLWHEVDLMCRTKYQQVGSRLRILAIRSLIYIFLTKMVLALILEVPLSQRFYGEINWTSIGINTFFPPFLMFVIVTFFRLPDEENTKKIFQRIIEIIDKDPSFETNVAFMTRKAQQAKRPILIFGFTVFYSLTFIITLYLIYYGLSYLQFNLISQGIFIFFVSVVAFFSYRIKQIANEYRLEEKEGILSPLVDFFFMPVLSLGKFFSSEIARLNFFIFIFDFLIEAPFKLVFEIVEEWISFVKKKKEEII